MVGFALLALVACNEEDDDETTEATSAPASEAATEEDTATADDGEGAMDGAADTAVAPEPEPEPASLSEVSQDAVDACIDALRGTEGATGGMVLSTEFSEANSLVMLQDGAGASWRCLVSNDGSNPDLQIETPAPADPASGEDTATADDGGGAMDGASGDLGVLSDFVGARGGQAEGGLTALGFEAVRSDGLVTYWFNRSTGICAQITTSDGVYSDITLLPAEDC
jgi:hypothetical protein